MAWPLVYVFEFFRAALSSEKCERAFNEEAGSKSRMGTQLAGTIASTIARVHR
jgi:hypothetical protein